MNPNLQIVDGASLNVLIPFEGYARITPETAARWLSDYGHTNPRCRIDRNRVQDIASDILAGLFRPDDDPYIKFSTLGNVNGRHRLSAVVVAGVAIVARIICGCDHALAKYQDINRPRALSDRMRFTDGTQQNIRASQMIQFWANLESRSVRRVKPERAEEIYAKKSRAIDFANETMTAKRRGIFKVPIICAVADMFLRDEPKSREFVATLVSPDGSACQPAAYLRNHMLTKGAGRGGSFSVSMTEYGRAVYACSAALAGERVTRLLVGQWPD